MYDRIDNRAEARGTAIVSLRALTMVVVAAALWHLPSGSVLLRGVLLVAAGMLCLLATAALLVASASWRNLVCRLAGVDPGGIRLVRFIGLAIATLYLAIAGAIFVAIGLAYG